MRSTKEPELKRLYEAEEEIENLIDLARSLEGLTRNAGMHAGGVVIAPSVLTDFAPLYCDERVDSVVTQFDKDDVEAAGLVKFDFLGLRTLTIIDCAVKIIKRDPRRARRGAARHLDAADGRRGHLRAAQEAQDHRGVPARIARHEGSRPAPASRTASRTSSRWSRCSARARCESGMVDDFIDRKHGRSDRRAPIDYLHPHAASRCSSRPTASSCTRNR